MIVPLGETTFNLNNIRGLAQAALNRDLSTETKGVLESLVVLNMLLENKNEKEALNVDVSLQHKIVCLGLALDYDDAWPTMTMLAEPNACWSVIETQNKLICVLSLPLFDWLYIIKQKCVIEQSIPRLKVLNALHKFFVDAGYGRFFQGYTKEKLTDKTYYLKASRGTP